MKRIKVINPNSTQSMTAKIHQSACSVAGPDTEIVSVSAASGPASVEGYWDAAHAAIGVLEEIEAGEKDGFDGYVIACFSDPGLLAAREFAKAPVVGIGESALHIASLISDGFTIVSMRERSQAAVERLVKSYGMDVKCRRVRMLNLPVLDLEDSSVDSRTLIVSECRVALQEDHSDCILLGCAGMTDVATYAAEQIGAPVIDGVAAAVKLVEALISMGLTTSKLTGYGT